MGQKAHPKSLRLGIVQGWDSTWIADPKEYARNVKEDHDIREMLKKMLKTASISKIEIDRKAQRLFLRIITGRPGVVVGRGGQGLDQIRQRITKLTGRKEIQVDVLEVARIDADAQLVSESIAQQLEKRVAYRRAIKQSIQRAMRAGAKGIKIMVSGRLGGTEIARTEWAKEGRIPLHTFRANIDYGFSEAKTTFGIIGVKVWIFHGEVLPGDKPQTNVKSRGPVGNDSGSGNQGLQGAGRRGRGGPGGGGGRRSSGPRAGAVKSYTVDNVDAMDKGAADKPDSKPDANKGDKE